jgi:hypothetical protein
MNADFAFGGLGLVTNPPHGATGNGRLGSLPHRRRDCTVVERLASLCLPRNDSVGE